MRVIEKEIKIIKIYYKIYIYRMELILILSLILNLCYTLPELKKLYLEYQYKKNNRLVYTNGRE